MAKDKKRRFFGGVLAEAVILIAVLGVGSLLAIITLGKEIANTLCKVSGAIREAGTEETGNRYNNSYTNRWYYNKTKRTCEKHQEW